MKKYLILGFLLLILLGTENKINAIPISWTGCKNTDWHLAANWNPQQVPTCADDVTIPTVTNYPVITAIAACLTISITSPVTDALTINTSGGGY